MPESSSSPPVRLALIGAGLFPQRAHYPALHHLQTEDRLKIVAVWSRTIQSAQALANKYPQPVDTYQCDQGLNALLQRNDIHAVIVAVPIVQTRRIVAMALRAGKHVLSEKPIAASIEEGRQLLRLHQAALTKTIYKVAENYRFEPAFQRASELVSENLGDLIAVDMTVHVSYGKSNRYQNTYWRKSPEHQGGNVLDSGVHYIAGLKTALGMNKNRKGGYVIRRVSGKTSLKSGHLKKMDTLVGFIELEKQNDDNKEADQSLTASVCFSMAAREQYYEMRIAGLHGVVRIVRGNHEGVNGYWVILQNPDGTDETFFKFQGVDKEIGAFIDECQGVKRWPALDPKFAFGDLACMESFFKASETHSVVDVPQL